MLTYYFVIVAVLLLAAAAQRQDAVGNRFAAEPHAVPPEAYPHSPAARNTFIVMAAIPTLVAGLRFRVGTDYGGYYFYWLDYANDFWVSLLQLHEPGYRAIAYLTQRLGCQTGALAIFLTSSITIGLGYWTVYRNSPQLFLPGVLFLFLGNWIGSFNAVRQCLAATMVFCGYPFLRDKKLWHYAAMVFAGFLCHRSAILMAIPVFFVHKEVNWRNVFLVLIGSIVVLNSYELLFHLAGEMLDKGYQNSEEDVYLLQKVNRLRVLSNVAPAAFFLWLHFKEKQNYQLSNFALNLLSLNAAISIVGMNSPYFSRYSMYTHPFMALAYPELCGKLGVNLRKTVITAIILMYTIMELYECSGSGSLRHFQWIWNAPL